MELKLSDGIKIKGRLRIAVWNPDGSLAEEQIIENLIVTAGKTAIANQFVSGSPSPDPLRVNYIALGSGTNAPAAGDTTLQTEVYRNATASGWNVSNASTLTGFYSATETSGTYREAGLFIAGTASANTGTLLSRVAINITKSAIQTLTIEWQVTIS